MTNELIRRTILLQLEAAYPISLPMETLFQGLQLSGLEVDFRALVKEIAYLQDRGFLLQTCSDLCPQSHRYKLATKGIDFLENEKTSSHRL